MQPGVVIKTIEPETPAYNSDLRPADIVTQVDGVPVRTAHELQKEVLKKQVGQTLELDVWRNGKAVKVKITTGQLSFSIFRSVRAGFGCTRLESCPRI